MSSSSAGLTPTAPRCSAAIPVASPAAIASRVERSQDQELPAARAPPTDLPHCRFPLELAVRQISVRVESRSTRVAEPSPIGMDSWYVQRAFQIRPRARGPQPATLHNPRARRGVAVPCERPPAVTGRSPASRRAATAVCGRPSGADAAPALPTALPAPEPGIADGHRRPAAVARQGTSRIRSAARVVIAVPVRNSSRMWRQYDARLRADSQSESLNNGATAWPE